MKAHKNVYNNAISISSNDQRTRRPYNVYRDRIRDYRHLPKVAEVSEKPMDQDIG